MLFFNRRKDEAGSVGIRPLLKKALARTLVFIVCAATAITTLNFSFATDFNPATDLECFVVDPITIKNKDGQGDPIPLDSTFTKGEDYQFTVGFKEERDKLFMENMTYRIPEGLVVFLNDPMPGIIEGPNKSEFYYVADYVIGTDGVISFTFTEQFLALGGKSFSLEINAKFDETGQNVAIDFGEGVTITVKVEDPPSGAKLNVEKSVTAEGNNVHNKNIPSKDIEYSVRITNTGTVPITMDWFIDDLFGSKPGDNDYLPFPYDNDKAFLKEFYSAMIIEMSINGVVSNHTIDFTQPPNFPNNPYDWVLHENPERYAPIVFFPEGPVLDPESGDYIEITYGIDIDKWVSYTQTDQKWANLIKSPEDYHFVLSNCVYAKGTDPDSNEVKDSDSKWLELQRRLYQKVGKLNAGTPNEGKIVFGGENKISWSVLVGNGFEDLAGKTITETLGPGQTIERIEFDGIPEIQYEANARFTDLDWSPENQAARQDLIPQFTLWSPSPPYISQEDWSTVNDYNAVNTYGVEYTITDTGYSLTVPEGLSPVHYVELWLSAIIDPETISYGEIYSNTVGIEEFINSDYTAKVGLPGPPEPTVKKTGRLMGEDGVGDGHYAEWTMEVRIPGTMEGVPVWLKDWNIGSSSAKPDGTPNGRNDPPFWIEDFQNMEVRYFNDSTPEEGIRMDLGIDYTVFSSFGNLGAPDGDPLPYGIKNRYGFGPSEFYILFGNENRHADRLFTFYQNFYGVDKDDLTGDDITKYGPGYLKDDFGKSLSPFSSDTRVEITFRTHIDKMMPWSAYPSFSYEDAMKRAGLLDNYPEINTSFENRVQAYWRRDGQRESLEGRDRIKWPLYKSGEYLPNGQIQYRVKLVPEMLKQMYETGNDVFFEDVFDERFEYVPNSFYLQKAGSPHGIAGGPYANTGAQGERYDYKDLLFEEFAGQNSFSVNLNDFDGVNTTNYTVISYEQENTWQDNWYQVYPGWYADPTYRYDVFYKVQPKDANPDYDGPPINWPLDQIPVKNEATIRAEGAGSFQNDATVKYGKPVVKKEMVQNPAPNNNTASISIEINPNEHKLILDGPATSFKVVDQMSDTLQFNLATIKLYKWDDNLGGSGGWELKTQGATVGDDWTYELLQDNTVAFFLPDRTRIKIEYQAFITIPVGGSGDTVWNSVVVNGEYTDIVEKKFIVLNSSGFGGGSLGELQLFKNDAKDTEKLLKGAKFGLYIDFEYPASDPLIGYPSFSEFVTDNIPSNLQTFTIGEKTFYILGIAETGDDGTITFGGANGFEAMWLAFNEVFALVELEVPDGYLIPEGSLADRAKLLLIDQPTSTQAIWLTGKKYSMIPGSYITIHNDPISFIIEGEKIVKGSEAPEEDFEFKLTQVLNTNGDNWEGPDDAITRTAIVETDGAGNYIIKFDEINGLKDGSYHFKVEESIPYPAIAPPGWEYDTNDMNSSGYVISVWIGIEDGARVAKISYPGDIKPSFTNKYTKPVDIKIKAFKIATGDDMGQYQFQFKLYNTDETGVLPTDAEELKAAEKLTRRNAEAGDTSPVYFQITYTEPGTYHYVMRETSPGGYGWTVDPREYLIKVEVTENDGALSATIEGYKYRMKWGTGQWITPLSGDWFAYDPETDTTWPEFLNIFSDSDPVKITLTALKTAEGNTMEAEQFDFGLYSYEFDGEVWGEGELLETAKNSDAGSSSDVSFAYFDNNEFSEAGDYYYLLYETTLDGDGWTVDTTEYLIWVKVTDPGQGQLEAKISYLTDVTGEDPSSLDGWLEISSDTEAGEPVSGVFSVLSASLRPDPYTYVTPDGEYVVNDGYLNMFHSGPPPMSGFYAHLTNEEGDARYAICADIMYAAPVNGTVMTVGDSRDNRESALAAALFDSSFGAGLSLGEFNTFFGFDGIDGRLNALSNDNDRRTIMQYIIWFYEIKYLSIAKERSIESEWNIYNPRGWPTLHPAYESAVLFRSVDFVDYFINRSAGNGDYIFEALRTIDGMMNAYKSAGEFSYITSLNMDFVPDSATSGSITVGYEGYFPFVNGLALTWTGDAKVFRNETEIFNGASVIPGEELEVSGIKGDVTFKLTDTNYTLKEGSVKGALFIPA